MKLIKIKSIEEQLSIIKSLNTLIDEEKDISFLHWYEYREPSKEEMALLLRTSLQLTLVLACQYFYSQVLENQNTYCMSMYFTADEFEQIKNTVYCLFNAKSVSKRRCYDLREILQVQVQGISEYAERFIAEIGAKNLFPQEIEAMYFDKEIISDIKENGIFEIVCEQNESNFLPGTFFEKICNDGFVHGLDISSVSFETFSETGFIQYLFNENKKAYICVSQCDDRKNSYLKHIVWK